MKKKALSSIAICSLALVAILNLVTGCGEPDGDGSHGHSHASGEAHDHGPTTPHGGTPVMIAEEKFRLELVADPSPGRMQAYVLDGHMESYIQVPETNFVVLAKTGDATRKLEFVRVPDAQSGTLAARSALFEAKADWLNTAKTFEGSIPTITLNGKTFTNVSFPFPKGTQHVH